MPAVFSPRLQRGYTLLELMLVLTIAAVITLGTLMAYRSYDGRQKAQRTVDAVGQMSDNLRGVFQTGAGCSSAADTATAGNAASTFAYCGSYGGVGNLQDYLVKSGVFPPALLNPDRTVTRSPWGGTIGATTTALNGNADSGMSLTFYAVPGNVCSPLVTRLDPLAARLEVGGQVVKDRTLATEKRLDINAVGTLCTSGTNVVLTLDSPSAYNEAGSNPLGLGSGTSGTIPASASSSVFVGPGLANPPATAPSFQQPDHGSGTAIANTLVVPQTASGQPSKPLQPGYAPPPAQ